MVSALFIPFCICVPKAVFTTLIFSSTLFSILFAILLIPSTIKIVEIIVAADIAISRIFLLKTGRGICFCKRIIDSLISSFVTLFSLFSSNLYFRFSRINRIDGFREIVIENVLLIIEICNSVLVTIV